MTIDSSLSLEGLLLAVRPHQQANGVFQAFPGMSTFYAWRNRFLEAGLEALYHGGKSKALHDTEEELRQAQKTIGRLTIFDKTSILQIFSNATFTNQGKHISKQLNLFN